MAGHFYKDEIKADDTIQQIERFGKRAFKIHGDIANINQVKSMMEKVKRRCVVYLLENDYVSGKVIGINAGRDMD